MYRYEAEKWIEKAWMWLAWRLPKTLVMWASIRLIAHATTGKHGSTVVPELTAMDALSRWGDDGVRITGYVDDNNILQCDCWSCQARSVCSFLRGEIARLEKEKMSLINMLYVSGKPEPKEWQG